MGSPAETPSATISCHSTSSVSVARPSTARPDRMSPPNADAGIADSEQDDLESSIGRLSLRLLPEMPTATMTVPPISAYAIGKPAVAVAGGAVVVGEPIATAETIPDNFASTSGYLKVSFPPETSVALKTICVGCTAFRKIR